MRYLCLILLTLFIVLGCSTTTKKNFSALNPEFLPPDSANWPINNQLSGDKDFESLDIYLNRVARENPALNTGWWADYRRAQLWMKKDKNVSCENFSHLAQDMRFPLRRVAFLHAHEVCPKDNQILERLEAFQLETFDPWLTESALSVAIEKAKAINDHAKLVELYIKKSKTSTRREEKVAFCDLAMKQAKVLGDKNKIHEIENRIYNLSPSRMPNPKAKDLLAVAADFRYLRNFERARATYQKIIHSRTVAMNDKLQAYRGIRLSYKIQQLRPEALKTTENLAAYMEKTYRHTKKTAADARVYADVQLQLARTYWTNDKQLLAAKILSRIEKAIKGRSSLSEEYWMRGRMAEEKQDFTAAIDWFRKALMEPIDSAATKDRINWYLAWNDRKAQNYDDAIQIFRDLKKHTDNPYEKNRFAFWLAKTLADKKQSASTKEANDEYAGIIKDDPIGFYGLLAHRELGLTLPIKKIRVDEANKKQNSFELTRRLSGMIDLPYFEWLTATRETEIARNYLDTVARALHKDAPSDLDSWYAIFQLYSKSQNYLSLFNQLNSLESTDRRAMLDMHPQLLFPAPYSETVSQAAGRFGVSPEFIYSIMRQESSFNPQARSQMDAFGLMQLLPEVAKRSAEANYIDYHVPEDLYEPFINIPIGSAYLRELWDKYNGEIILAVASYNASADAISNWRRTRYRGDTLEFIEDIPYDETRDYVKLVLRNLIAYELLSTRDDKMIFPEWTLKISSDTAASTGRGHAPASSEN
jgi:soluble lytic murein transglycosylase